LFENFSKLALSDKLFAVLNLLPVDGSCTNRSTLDEIAFFEGKADLFRRNILDEYGLFNERLSLTAEDQDLSARMRADGYKICQNTNCRFKVFFSATQDTIWKVLNKQRTYARGQAFVIAKHKGGVFARTTRNRNLRMIHRIGQLAFIGISMFVAVLAWVWPIMLPMLVLITLSRVGYYMFLGRKLCTWECLVSGVVGLAGDYFYAVGFIQGLMLKMLRERG
jgi:cellulose synthase/poly-beta-1,6-N-acetylglucosamine synthase-like glycosyltransferase